MFVLISIYVKWGRINGRNEEMDAQTIQNYYRGAYLFKKLFHLDFKEEYILSTSRRDSGQHLSLKRRKLRKCFWVKMMVHKKCVILLLLITNWSIQDSKGATGKAMGLNSAKQFLLISSWSIPVLRKWIHF